MKRGEVGLAEILPDDDAALIDDECGRSELHVAKAARERSGDIQRHLERKRVVPDVVENGFFGNERIRIPLPDSLRKAEGLMRAVCMGKQADELVLRMNRAAEAAVPEAKALLVDAVKRITVADAKDMLTGGDDAATRYFRRTTSEPLAQRFLPIVRKAMERVKLAEKYNEFAERGARFGMVKGEDARLENYVTRKSLDGLYTVIAEEEKKIRQDPVGSASSMISKVFGAIGR